MSSNMIIFWDVEPQSVTEVIDSTSSGTSPAIVMIELRYAISKINWVGLNEDSDESSSTADSTTSTSLLCQPVETFVYKTDMASFSHSFSRRLSAEQTINKVLMESRTGAGVSSEYRLPLIRCITNNISAHMIMSGGIIRSDHVVKVHFVFDLCEERHIVRNFDEYGEEGLLRKIVESFAGEMESFYDVDLMEYLVTDQEVDASDHHQEEKKDCSICLDELVDGTEVKRCPCAHRFHGECIARWLERKESCPLCRRKVQDWIM